MINSRMSAKEERIAYLESTVYRLVELGHKHEDAIRELLNDAESVPCPEEPKPIDWSKVADCVPVKVWDDGEEGVPVVLYADATRAFNSLSVWEHASLITDIDIAWSGGECPLPEGVLVDVTLRTGEFVAGNPGGANYIRWHHEFDGLDIISFRVTGIADGWTEDMATTKEAK